MEVRYGKIGPADACLECKNKCANCKYKDECDFDFVYRLHGKNSDLLGPCMPASLKESFRNNEIIIAEDNLGFCEFHVCKRDKHTTVYHICTTEHARGKGIARQFLEFLRDKYKLGIQAVCISNSASEKFWSKVAKKISDKVSRKGTKLSVYYIGDTPETATMKKEELF